MRDRIGLVLILTVILVGAGFWAHAQVQPPNGPRVLPSPRVAPPPGQENQNPTIISGGDVGFRVERWEGAATASGWSRRRWAASGGSRRTKPKSQGWCLNAP
jgi:hypothetical protein